MLARIAEWQAVLADATGRETVDDGIAVTFDHNITRTTELGRLRAAEYARCSFASYALILDARGTRIEIRPRPRATTPSSRCSASPANRSTRPCVRPLGRLVPGGWPRVG